MLEFQLLIGAISLFGLIGIALGPPAPGLARVRATSRSRGAARDRFDR